MGPRSQDRPQRQTKWKWGLYLVILAVVGFTVVRLILPSQSAPPSPADRVLAELDTVDRVELAPGSAAGSNVLIITMDTTRADHLACYGNDRIRTPVLDDLARRGVLFARAYTPTPSTLPGHSSIFTGLNPYRHGARANGTYRLGTENITLAEVLSDNGYATGGFIAAYVLDSRFGLDQGFDVYGDDLTKGVKHSSHSFRERPAQYVNESAEAWLDTVGDEPFFLWVHYFDPHAPYYAPEPFRSRYAGNDYDGEIAYVDAQIGRLLAHLDELGRLDDTLVVLAGDHGEGLGEHNEATHSLLVYDSTLHTPLIMCPPASASEPMGHVVKRSVSNVDIMPTVLDLLAIEAETEFDGVSLLAEPEDNRSIYGETLSTLVLHGWSPLFTVCAGGLKYIHAPRPELYDLVHDPKELENLFASRPEEAVELSLALADHVGDDLFGADALAQSVEMDPETARALGALGYVGSVGDDVGEERLDPKDMVPHYERVNAADHALGMGQFREAVAELEACLEIVPNDVHAMRLLAQAYLAKVDAENARTIVERILELDTDDPLAITMLGQVEMASQNPAMAEQAFRKALELDPEYATVYVSLGSLYADMSRPEEAIEFFHQAIAMDPGTTGPMAYCALGRMHLGRLELELARDAFSRALDINEISGGAHRGMAAILLEEGNLEEAQEELDLAVRYTPNDAFALSTLAGLAVKRGEFAEAIALAQCALDIHPAMARALDAMGRARAASGDLVGARTAFETLLGEEPEDVSGLMGLARLNMGESRGEEGAELYRRVLDINPDQPTALISLGARKASKEEYGEATVLYERAAAVQPENALVRYHLGMLLMLQERPAEALPHLEESLRLDPNQPERERVAQVVQYLRSQGTGAEGESESSSPPPP